MPTDAHCPCHHSILPDAYVFVCVCVCAMPLLMVPACAACQCALCDASTRARCLHWSVVPVHPLVLWCVRSSLSCCGCVVAAICSFLLAAFLCSQCLLRSFAMHLVISWMHCFGMLSIFSNMSTLCVLSLCKACLSHSELLMDLSQQRPALQPECLSRRFDL